MRNRLCCEVDFGKQPGMEDRLLHRSDAVSGSLFSFISEPKNASGGGLVSSGCPLKLLLHMDRKGLLHTHLLRLPLKEKLFCHGGPSFLAQSLPCRAAQAMHRLQRCQDLVLSSPCCLTEACAAAEGEEESGRPDKCHHKCTVNHILVLQPQLASAEAASDICLLLRELAVALGLGRAKVCTVWLFPTLPALALSSVPPAHEKTVAQVRATYFIGPACNVSGPGPTLMLCIVWMGCCSLLQCPVHTHDYLGPVDNSLMSRHVLWRWWTRAEANSNSWHTSSRALPSDSSFRRDLACLLEEPPNWQRAQVPSKFLMLMCC